MRIRDIGRSFWGSDDAFAEHRLRTALVAFVAGTVAVLALVVGPTDPSNRFTTVWVTAFATVLSLAVITLVYELLLRQSHARALRKFIQLNATVVRSGLVAIDEEADVPWRDLFTSTTSATFVLVGPYSALGFLNDLLSAARGRVVRARFCFPDLADRAVSGAGQESSRTISDSIGADDRLGGSIASTVDDLLSAFDRRSGELGGGSMLEIAEYDRPIFMEGVILDRSTVLMPIEAAGRPRGAPPTCQVFSEGSSPEVQRLRAGLLAVSDAATQIEGKVTP